jgi:hypothetical protein
MNSPKTLATTKKQSKFTKTIYLTLKQGNTDTFRKKKLRRDSFNKVYMELWIKYYKHGMYLHTLWMIVGFVVDNTVPNNLLFAHSALLLHVL